MSSKQKESVLKQLLTEINISDSLREQWLYLKQHHLELLDSRLIRIFPKSTEKFVLLYELELKSTEKIFKQQIFAEWYGDNADKQSQSLTLQLQKAKRAQLKKGQLMDHSISHLPDLGLVIRIQGLDERIDGLGIFKRPELLAEVLEKQLGFNKGSILTPEIRILGHRLGKRCIAQVSFQQRHGLQYCLRDL